MNKITTEQIVQHIGSNIGITESGQVLMNVSQKDQFVLSDKNNALAPQRNLLFNPPLSRKAQKRAIKPQPFKPSYIFVVDNYGGIVRKFTFSGDAVGTYGAFNDPWGMVLNSEKTVFFVADAGNYRIQKLTRSFEYITEWGEQGTDPGQFDSCRPLAISDSFLFVGDFHGPPDPASRIQKFDHDGNFIAEWGEFGGATYQQGKFYYIVGMYAHNDILYVSGGWGYIQLFDFSGTWLDTWGMGNGGGRDMDNPRCIGINSSGIFYVADYYQSKVHMYNLGGTHLGSWGVKGTGDGQLFSPTGLLIDSEDYVWITQYNYGRIQKFTPDGDFILRIDGIGRGCEIACIEN